jgi:hypothetical protein
MTLLGIAEIQWPPWSADLQLTHCQTAGRTKDQGSVGPAGGP